MKVNFLALATIIIGMQSCSQSEVINTEANEISNSINFSTYSNLTRGASMESNEMFKTNGNSFGVTAFVNVEGYKEAYMGSANVGAEIIYNEKWNYKVISDTRFWPTQSLNFFAYAPFSDVTRVAPSFDKSNGMTFTDYTIPTSESAQKDFMYASAINQKKPQSGTTVTMNFKHALTQVHFKARTSSSNLFVDIEGNGITLNKIKSKGTFNLNTTSASWTGQTDEAPYTATSDAKTISYSADQFTALTTAGNALMLMPQEFSAWTPSSTIANADGSYLSISCKIYTKTLTGDQKVYLFGSADSYNTLYVPFSSKSYSGTDGEIWNMNNKITYNLTFGGGYDADGNPVLNLIEFETTVEDWSQLTGNDIILK